jgi:hypothetical protein
VTLGSLRSVLYSQRVSSVLLRALVKRLRRIGGVSVGVDDPQLGVSFGQSFVDEVNFADQLRSELNPPAALVLDQGSLYYSHCSS